MDPDARRIENHREHQLLRSIADDDREAFTELFGIYHPRLFRFLYRLTHSYSISEELVNDIMLLVWRKASAFRGDSKVSTWIFGIAYRQTMKRLSRDKHIGLQLTDDTDSIADRPAVTDDENWVREGLRSLPAIHRVTATLVFYVGLSYEEVAQVSDCPVSTVKTRMFHARRKLREILPAIALPNCDCDDKTPGVP